MSCVACSGPSATPKVAGSQGARESNLSAPATNPAAGAGTGTATVPPHATPQQTVAAARKAIDEWLDALVREDAGAMIAHSTSAAKGLGGVQLVVHAILKGQGESITTRVTRESITQAHIATAAVTFAGEIDLRDTITGQKKRTVDSRIDGPIQVNYEGGAWKVRTFTYDRATMRYFPELAEQTIDDIHLNVGFVLTYATTTTVAVTLRSSTEPSISIKAVILRGVSGANKAGHAFFTHGKPAGIFDFVRTEERPARLEVQVQEVDGKVATFSIDLPGQQS